MRVGMAVDSGKAFEKRMVARLLRDAVPLAKYLNLWVDGRPFWETILAIENQLKEETEIGREPKEG